MLGQNIEDANERIADLTVTGRCDRIDCSSKAKVDLYIKHWHKSAKRSNVVWSGACRRRAGGGRAWNVAYSVYPDQNEYGGKTFSFREPCEGLAMVTPMRVHFDWERGQSAVYGVEGGGPRRTSATWGTPPHGPGQAGFSFGDFDPGGKGVAIGMGKPCRASRTGTLPSTWWRRRPAGGPCTRAILMWGEIPHFLEHEFHTVRKHGRETDHVCQSWRAERRGSGRRRQGVQFLRGGRGDCGQHDAVVDGVKQHHVLIYTQPNVLNSMQDVVSILFLVIGLVAGSTSPRPRRSR